MNAKENATNWQNYTETEEDKKIYLPHNGKPKKILSEEENKQDIDVDVEAIDISGSEENGNSAKQLGSSDKADGSVAATI